MHGCKHATRGAYEDLALGMFDQVSNGFRHGQRSTQPSTISVLPMMATVQSSSSGVYLQARWYDTYMGDDWLNAETSVQLYHAQESTHPQTSMTSLLRQMITIVTPTQEHYLLGAPGISAVSLPATVLTNSRNGEPVAWFAQHQKLAAGTQYTVTSSVSTAGASALRTVLQPIKAFQSGYEADLLSPFLQLPNNLDPRIERLARQITAAQPTMYDKVAALASYLRTHYTYNLQVSLPAGKEAVSWFLFDNGHQGYCTYFATAMAILARSIGIPARLATGYAPGSYDPQQQRQVIRGTDAHSWTQIYFADYGWVNFEPTPGFTTSGRILHNATAPAARHNANTYGSASGWGLDRVIGTVMGGLTAALVVLILVCLLWLQRLRPRAKAGELYRYVCLLATLGGNAPRRSQTPWEYTRQLLQAMPQAREALEHMCSLYMRERWAHPASSDHPGFTGELHDVPALWRQLKPQLVKVLLRHWGRLLRFR